MSNGNVNVTCLLKSIFLYEAISQSNVFLFSIFLAYSCNTQQIHRHILVVVLSQRTNEYDNFVVIIILVYAVGRIHPLAFSSVPSIPLSTTFRIKHARARCKNETNRTSKHFTMHVTDILINPRSKSLTDIDIANSDLLEETVQLQHFVR